MTGVGHNRLVELAEEIRGQHGAALDAAETATKHAMECGRLLVEAKEAVGHGEWLPWLRDNCDLSERTAQAYMRLHRKTGELDSEKAQRVADLPVRDALKAVADERVDVELPGEGADWDEVWGWAGRQVAAPFNMFDLESVSHSAALLENKLLNQTRVPVSVGVFLPMHTDEIPTIRMVSLAEIFDAISCLKDVAHGDCSGLDIDHAGMNDRGYAMMGCLTIIAQRFCGRLFREIKDRDYKTVNPDEWGDQYQRDYQEVHSALMASLDAKKTELLCDESPS